MNQPATDLMAKVSEELLRITGRIQSLHLLRGRTKLEMQVGAQGFWEINVKGRILAWGPEIKVAAHEGISKMEAHVILARGRRYGELRIVYDSATERWSMGPYTAGEETDPDINRIWDEFKTEPLGGRAYDFIDRCAELMVSLKTKPVRKRATKVR